ncbi:hypothetical protein RB653_005415 [Dictyostelium firmibasis]|uniref:Large ribosomal subunit protein bL25 L25 domain-containing protein n=1 Tax=Dictyostelium firmibasis TaxID=79012 RepID=A0AAN7UBG2_9MYCE
MNSIKSITSLASGLSQSIFKRGFFVRGKNTMEIKDPNAATTYPIKHLYCLDRKVKGKAGAKLVRHNDFVPATITGGGFPLKNISLEWGRVYGLISSKKFYKGRKFLLNIDEKEKFIGKLVHTQMHPLTERAMFLKFNRSHEDPETFKSEELPHLSRERMRQEKLAADRVVRKAKSEIQKIDLSFKPVIKKTELSKERLE